MLADSPRMLLHLLLLTAQSAAMCCVTVTLQLITWELNTGQLTITTSVGPSRDPHWTSKDHKCD